MARPQKQTVDYFPHFADASVGDTLTVLEGQFGNDGYVFWFKLLEKLASSEGHYLDCSNSRKWQVLLGRARVDEDTGRKIMVLLVEMQAIDKDLWENHNIIWCQNLVDNVAEAYKNRKREVPQKPDLASAKLNSASKHEISTEETPVSTSENPISTTENPHTKLDDTILNNKESKETDRDDLYKILEGTRGFPKYSQENIWKLEDVIKDYPELNYLLEFKKFREYWNDDKRKLKRPWLALRNWLENAKKGYGRTKKTERKRLPDRSSYTQGPDYPDD